MDIPADWTDPVAQPLPGLLLQAGVGVTDANYDEFDEVDTEAWISAVASLWSYVEHKVAGTAPATLPFKDIRAAPIVPRQGRSLFAEDRKKVL